MAFPPSNGVRALERLRAPQQHGVERLGSVRGEFGDECNRAIRVWYPVGDRPVGWEIRRRRRAGHVSVAHAVDSNAIPVVDA